MYGFGGYQAQQGSLILYQTSVIINKSKSQSLPLWLARSIGAPHSGKHCVFQNRVLSIPVTSFLTKIQIPLNMTMTIARVLLCLVLLALIFQVFSATESSYAARKRRYNCCHRYKIEVCGYGSQDCQNRVNRWCLTRNNHINPCVGSRPITRSPL